MSEHNFNADLTILGGGLAGLTLALQVKKERPETNIIVLEKRSGDAPTAAHKVGESTVELGTYYLREVLGLGKYLDEHQLPKHGLRFFFSPLHKKDISKRVELGPRARPPMPSHQLDRGVLENDLIRFNEEAGNQIILSATVKEVDLGENDHKVRYESTNGIKELRTKWVVDATGRREFLKRKLKFHKEMDHNVNAVWFRYSEIIDVQKFSDNEEWKNQLKPGMRRLSTVHFMDKGYWVWLIPLVNDSTSVGIVADGDIHDMKDFNNFEKAMTWMRKNEPLCAAELDKYEDKVLDFRVLKHYSHHSGRFYSGEGWGVTGESGAFLDPFYSPGTDFISFSNSWLTDLITCNLNGDDIGVKSLVYEQMHNAFIKNWLPIYQNKYRLFGNTQVMVTKIFWDWATYWGVSTLMFTNKGFINLKIIKQLFLDKDAVLKKLGELNTLTQQLFIDWGEKDDLPLTEKYLDPLDISYLNEFHHHIQVKHTDEELIDTLRENMMKLEHIAAEIFRRVSHVLNNTPIDMKVNPYKISLSPSNGSSIEDIHADGIGVNQKISKDVDYFWFHSSKDIMA